MVVDYIYLVPAPPRPRSTAQNTGYPAQRRPCQSTSAERALTGGSQRGSSSRSGRRYRSDEPGTTNSILGP